MKVDRNLLLHKLLCLSPAVSRQEVILQSSCVVFRNGWMYAMSVEIAAAIPSGMPKKLDCALKVDKLTKLLKIMPDSEFEVKFDESSLVLKGDRREVQVPLEAKVLLPIDEVERPGKEDWREIGEDFSEAVSLASRCAKSKSEDSFALECVHVSPKFVEGCDDSRMLRYTVPTFVKSSILVRASVISEMAKMGMTRAAETENWLHFKNPLPLRLSVKKYGLEHYPNLTPFLGKRGRAMTFPKSVLGIAQRAGLFAETGVRFRVGRGGCNVVGQSDDGRYTEDEDVEYRGSDVTFSIPSKLIEEIIQKHQTFEVTDSTIRVDGGKYVYCAALEA